MSVQKSYQKLRDELEQYGNRHGATALADEKSEELEALIRMEELLQRRMNDEF